ncbi:hypothetical protein B5E56_13635 [Flavonifractor sp. An112]|nr:hypothetical protein B5E56_13635 [Flavonifractor sp. An112]
MMKRILSAVLLTALLSTQAMAFTFEQVPVEDLFAPEVIEQERVSDWAKEEVDIASSLGLVPPLTDQPAFTGSITREQFAELIVNLVEKALDKEIEAAPSDTFTDTSNTAVLKAYEAGIITGVGGDKFAPKTTTNREQIATMIYRAVQYLAEQTGKDLTPNPGSIDLFTDKAGISGWAAEAVGKLAANDIMKGSSSTTASPQAACTVEQSILLIYRVYQKI